MVSGEEDPKRPRAHHLLPQFYLRAWADRRGLVAMLRRDGREVQTGTKSLGVENDFYTATSPDGKRDATVEEALASWDSKGAAVHAAFVRGEFPPSDQQRIEFGLWLGLQWLRGRSSRRLGRESFDLINKLLVELGLGEHPISRKAAEGKLQPPDEAELEGLGPSLPVPDLTGLSNEVKQILRDPSNYNFEPSREQQLLAMLEGVPDAAAPFIEAEWHLLRFEQPILLTCDEPITLAREPTPQNRFLGLGPSNADYLSIPLGPSVTLGMIRRDPIGAESAVTLPLAHAEHHNQAILETWWSQLFRHPAGPAFPDSFPPRPERRVEIA